MAAKLKQPNKQPQGRVCWFSSFFSGFQRQKLLIKQYTIRCGRPGNNNRTESIFFAAGRKPTAPSVFPLGFRIPSSPSWLFLAPGSGQNGFLAPPRDPFRRCHGHLGGVRWKCTPDLSLRFRPHIPPAKDSSLGVFTPESVVKFSHQLTQSAASWGWLFWLLVLCISRAAPTPWTDALLYHLWYRERTL